jgi:hypothetical protein
MTAAEISDNRCKIGARSVLFLMIHLTANGPRETHIYYRHEDYSRYLHDAKLKLKYQRKAHAQNNSRMNLVCFVIEFEKEPPFKLSKNTYNRDMFWIHAESRDFNYPIERLHKKIFFYHAGIHNSAKPVNTWPDLWWEATPVEYTLAKICHEHQAHYKVIERVYERQEFWASRHEIMRKYDPAYRAKHDNITAITVGSRAHVGTWIKHDKGFSLAITAKVGRANSCNWIADTKIINNTPIFRVCAFAPRLPAPGASPLP